MKRKSTSTAEYQIELSDKKAAALFARFIADDNKTITALANCPTIRNDKKTFEAAKCAARVRINGTYQSKMRRKKLTNRYNPRMVEG